MVLIKISFTFVCWLLPLQKEYTCILQIIHGIEVLQLGNSSIIVSCLYVVGMLDDFEFYSTAYWLQAVAHLLYSRSKEDNWWQLYMQTITLIGRNVFITDHQLLLQIIDLRLNMFSKSLSWLGLQSEKQCLFAVGLLFAILGSNICFRNTWYWAIGLLFLLHVNMLWFSFVRHFLFSRACDYLQFPVLSRTPSSWSSQEKADNPAPVQTG